MKNLLIAALLIAAVVPAHAVQPITWDQEGIDQMIHGKRHTPAMDSLQGVADGTCSAAECFDGNPILRREEPGLVILKEQFIRYQHPRHHGGREGGDITPAKYVYKQTVGIEDREKYVAGSKTGGKIAGGLLGVLVGALAFMGGPIVGGLVLLGAVAGGVKLGGDIASKDAQNQPKIYERTMEYETKPSA